MDRVQDARGKGKKGKNDHQKGKRKDAKGKGEKGKEIRKEQNVITRAKVEAKTRKAKVWQRIALVESQDILLKTFGGTIFDR